MFESPLSERKTDPAVSGAVNIAVEFYRRMRGEYHTLPSVSGSLVPPGMYRGCNWREGVPRSPPITRSDIQANILPLPVIPSSRVYSARSVRLLRVQSACTWCMWASWGFPGEPSGTMRKNDAVVPMYIAIFFLSQTVFQWRSRSCWYVLVVSRLRIRFEFIQSRHF